MVDLIEGCDNPCTLHNVKYPTPERCWHQGAPAASANVTHDIDVDRDQFQSEVGDSCLVCLKLRVLLLLTSKIAIVYAGLNVVDVDTRESISYGIF